MRRSGFTLIELIVVIVIIAILATLTTLGTNRYMMTGRDAQRQANVTTISESLEKYYDKNGEYPSCADLSGSTSSVATSVLGNIDPSALVAPSSSSDETTSIKCGVPLTVNGEDFFEYVGDGSIECTSGGACLVYQIKYKEESSGTIATVSSRRMAIIDSSGTITASAGSATYTTTPISWNSLSNATGYTVQRDTSSSFNSGNLTERSVNAPSTSYLFNDIGPGTTYYYRVRAIASNGISQWSNTVSRATPSLPVPTLTNTQNLPDRVTESWNSIANMTSYTIQRSSTSDFSSGVNTDTGTFTSKTYSDTPIGSTRYYRVRANLLNAVTNVTYNGAWSTPITYASFVPAPPAPSITATTNSSTATGTSGTVTCSQTGTPHYSLRETHKANSGDGDSWSSWSAWSTTVRTYDLTAYQGYQHTFQARAACVYNGVYSSPTLSSTASSVRGIDKPPIPTWPSGLSKSWQNLTYGHYMWYGTYCPAGTWANETWFHSWGWIGDHVGDFYHTFGFNDYWILGPSGGAGVEYQARYTCASSYTSSPWSDLSYDSIWVYP